MKVAFWSNACGCGVTSCVIAAGVLGAHLLGAKIALFDNHQKSEGILDMLLGAGAGSIYPGRTGWGMEKYEQYLARKTGRRLLYPRALEIIGENLIFHCNEPRDDSLVFERDFMEELVRSEQTAGSFGYIYDYCMVDTQNSLNMSTRDVLDQADAVVIILPQRQDEMHTLLRSYKALFPKAFFVFNKYTERPKQFLERFCEWNGIDINRTFTIPYCRAADEAAQRGYLVDFLRESCNTVMPGDVKDYISSLTRLIEGIACEA